MYNNGYEYYATQSTNSLATWTVIALIIAIAGGLALYFAFLKSDKKVDGMLSKIKDFLNFKSLLIEAILKISYLIIAIYITLYSFGLIGTSVSAFVILLIGGNISLRLTYEICMLLIKICKNTTEINDKLKK